MDEAIKLENYSYEDYLDIDKSTKERVELIDGQIYMMAGASAAHQDAVGNIFFILKTLAKESKEECFPRVAPYDLKLFDGDDKNVVQPDIMLFCDKDELPCAIFEVLSDSTAHKDKGVKKELYERFGIREYLIVDTALKIVDRYILSDNRYFYDKGYSIEDKMSLECIEGEIAIDEVFENIGK